MNELQKEVLIGCCLGDIAIHNVSSTSTRFQITHCLKQKNYVTHKYKIFKNLCGSPPKEKDRKYPVWYFNTLSSSNLKEILSMFWSGNVRGVPHNVVDLVTERSLAYWFMDDGGCEYVSITPRLKTRNSVIILSTDRYKESEVDLLIDMLDIKFGIISKKKNSKSMKQRIKIYIGTEFTQKFLNIIEPFIIPSMRYKIRRPYTIDKPNTLATTMGRSILEKGIVI